MKKRKSGGFFLERPSTAYCVKSSALKIEIGCGSEGSQSKQSKQSMSSQQASQASQAQVSMTDLEYVQNMPPTHLLLQQQANNEIRHWWNLVDHERVVENNTYIFEETLLSPGVELARRPYLVDGVPPSLSLCYSICSRRWEREQRNHVDARIGEIFFAKNGTGHWQHQECVTYALERVDAPHRWNKYCVHHLPSESFIDVIRQHTQ